MTDAEGSHAGGTLLLAEDDDVLRARMARAFAERGYDVVAAATAQSALAQTRARRPRRAVVDLRLPDRSGLWLLQTLLEAVPDCKVVVLTGYGSIASAIDAVRLGATYYVAKPADVDEIERAFAPPPPKCDVGRQASAPSLARAEWEHISRVLSDCEGNISEAARRLGIHRRSLQRKLQKYPPRQ